ncbi:MAG TPA: hypothetical protein VFL85_00340 [Candidatus Saccharimonadales bacterium]|nr:hypothetical protein [Candidatus Saccharimonadales bacterium]
MRHDKTKNRHISRISLLGLAVLAVIGIACAWHVAQKDTGAVKQTEKTDLAVSMDPAEYTKRITHPDVSYNLVIKDNAVASGPSAITVQKGQSVNIDFSTLGEEVDLELEGYGIISETNNIQGGGFHFIADKRGTFKFFIPSEEEEHTQGTAEPAHDIQLGTVTVK